jgi:Ca2+-binding RTX toxin-like protein
MTLDSSFGVSGKTSIGGRRQHRHPGRWKDSHRWVETPPQKFRQTRIVGDSPTALAYGKNKLKISGTSANDVIKISKSAGLLAVSRNGAAPFYFTASKVKRLIIDAGSGDDTIILSKSVPTAIINGGDGDDTLIGKRRKDKTMSIEHS